jgi:hypothetical protein
VKTLGRENGHERQSSRRGSWYNQIVPFETAQSNPSAGIYLFSHALRTAEYQPSGTCNYSRVDNASLHLTFKSGGAGTDVANVTSEDQTLDSVTDLTNLLIFAENYNVLRVMSGINFLCQTVGCRIGSKYTNLGKQCKSWRSVQRSVKPTSHLKMATSSVAGTFLEPSLLTCC